MTCIPARRSNQSSYSSSVVTCTEEVNRERERVFEILKAETETAMRLLGGEKVSQLASMQGQQSEVFTMVNRLVGWMMRC